MNGRAWAGLTLYHLTEDPLDYLVHERQRFKQGQMSWSPEECLEFYDGHDGQLREKYDGREHPELPDAVGSFLHNI